MPYFDLKSLFGGDGGDGGDIGDDDEELPSLDGFITLIDYGIVIDRIDVES